MPPHLSHLLQPRDAVCFSVVKRVYNHEIDSLIRHHNNHITKLEFLPAFKAAFTQSFTKANICFTSVSIDTTLTLKAYLRVLVVITVSFPVA
jgi:hypothetical protein